MQIISDSLGTAKKYVGNKQIFFPLNPEQLKGSAPGLLSILSDKDNFFTSEFAEESFFKYFFIIGYSKESQFEAMQNFLSKHSDYNYPSILVAHEGENFRGQHNRNWEALAGNLHLVLFFQPNVEINSSNSTSFNIISSVSLIETLDEIQGLEGAAKTKWINDILIEGSKVAGCIAQSNIQEDLIQSVVLGIGLNVENSPKLPESAIQRATTSLREHQKNADICNLESILKILLQKIKKNYEDILNSDHKYMLDLYIKRNAVLGKKVAIHPAFNETSDLKTGVVERIGEDLSLYLDSEKEPITSGRLVILD
ncbi:MAG: biotin--[acetyl-CoA-carboxylase] ligase [Ignavibacteria bacterium]|jgi:biotin-[acetyl-CoA-carboxylase] ligase BirA-like protein|nr:biotin--[acetyl-CoA-carboxylase] ligase [Ignavibacteria bacterium]